MAKTRDGSNCGPLLFQAENKLRDGTVRSAVTRALAAIGSRVGPNTKIVLLGYPFLEGDKGYRLRSGRGGNTFIAAGKRIRDIGSTGDTVQQEVVDALNRADTAQRFVFVKTKALFAGPPTHELFANKNNAQRWFIQPFVDASVASFRDYYHPNPMGWSEEAKLLFKDARVPKQRVPGGLQLAGRWSGPLVQAPPATVTEYGVELALSMGAGGSIGGTVSYPELACGGTLTNDNTLPDGTVVLSERITFGTANASRTAGWSFA